MPDATLEDSLTRLTAGDDEQAEVAAHDLAQLGDNALAALRALAGDGNEDHRWWACRTLRLHPSPDAVGLLLARLDDPDEAVQVCAMLALAERGAVEAIEPLINKLATPGGYVARQAEEGLRQIGAPASPALAAALGDDNPQVRGLAARALAHLTDIESIPALFDHLEDDSTFVQFWAEEGLARRGVGQVYFKP